PESAEPSRRGLGALERWRRALDRRAEPSRRGALHVGGTDRTPENAGGARWFRPLIARRAGRVPLRAGSRDQLGGPGRRMLQRRHGVVIGLSQGRPTRRPHDVPRHFTSPGRPLWRLALPLPRRRRLRGASVAPAVSPAGLRPGGSLPGTGAPAARASAAGSRRSRRVDDTPRADVRAL